MSETKSKVNKLDLDQVYARLLELLVRHSPYDLNYSKISRATGVPRPTLYYYFGNSKQNIIDEAIKYGIKNFVRFYQMEQNIKEHSSWHDFQKARLVDVLRMARNNPWAPTLYFRFRSQDNSWGEEIRSVENIYINKLCQAWLEYNKVAVDPQKMRFANYLKVGVLWGVSEDVDSWFEKGGGALSDAGLKKIEQIAEQMTTIVTQILTSID